MGAYQNNGNQGGSRSKKRGTTKNKDRLEAFASASPTSGGDWASCDEKWLADVVVKITAMGGAVTFGLSRDMGAHSLTLMLDGERQTMWYNGDEDLTAALEAVSAKLEAMVA
jgi:hypothetical protein